MSQQSDERQTATRDTLMLIQIQRIWDGMRCAECIHNAHAHFVYKYIYIIMYCMRHNISDYSKCEDTEQ